MKIVGIYSFNGGREVIEAQFAVELREVEQVVAVIDSFITRHEMVSANERLNLTSNLK